jgi:hypothetical protein
MIDADRTNVDKHAQPVKHFAPFRARGSDRMSVRCVVDTIYYRFCRKLFEYGPPDQPVLDAVF